MKTIICILISIAAAATSFADVNGNALLNAGGQIVPDSSSSALLLGMALVASLLVGRRFIKK